jgi:hypothetical protein
MSLSWKISFSRGAIAASLGLTVFVCSCKQNESPKTVQDTFSSPDDAAKALVAAAKSNDPNAIALVLGPGSKEITSSQDPEQDKKEFAGFVSDYDVMHRWRTLEDGSQLLLTGTDNKAFPVPLKKNNAGQFYFDVQAGKAEIAAREIGRDENAAIDICGAIGDAQQEYFSQRHGGVNQYAQKFISDSGQQNGLYWPEVNGQSKSPLGPLVAFATAEGLKVQQRQHEPFYGYYFAILDKQGPNVKGGSKAYIVDGKMTRGFAVVAYPAQYRESGIMTFIMNQDGTLFQKDLGTTTADVAANMTQFNPDSTWTTVE